MISSHQLAGSFALNLNILRWQSEGLTNEDSLLQPPFRGNCLNWVLGHIAVSRDRVLRLFGEEPTLSEAETACYETESQPLTSAREGSLTLETLLERLERAQAGISAALEGATPEALTREIKVGERTMTVGERLFGLYFHETYHTGQTELLRQLAGTNDGII